MTDYNKVEHKKNVNVKKESEDDSVEQRPRAEQIVTAKKRKRGLMERIVVGLAGPEGIPSVSHYIGREIIIPATKDLFVNAVSSAVNMVVYGQDKPASGYRGPARTTNYNSRPTTNYQQSYLANNSMPSFQSRTEHAGFNSLDYTIDTRQDALHVLSNMQQCVADYGVITVSDFYDMLGIESSFTDNAYGWVDNIDNTAHVVSTRGGYAIQLPRPVAVSR